MHKKKEKEHSVIHINANQTMKQIREIKNQIH